MLRLILIGAGTVVVLSVEKLPLVEAYALKVRVIDGIVFGLPFLVLAIALEWHARSKAKAKAAAVPARPSSFSYTQPGRRG
jgi:hypothetical protein